MFSIKILTSVKDGRKIECSNWYSDFPYGENETRVFHMKTEKLNAYLDYNSKWADEEGNVFIFKAMQNINLNTDKKLELLFVKIGKTQDGDVKKYSHKSKKAKNKEIQIF